MRRISKTKQTIIVALLFASMAQAGDWPQFRGPTRDGICVETGLLRQWPAAGPREIWSYGELGHGYASVSVVNGIVYTTGMEADDQGYLYALKPDGTLQYKVAYGPEWKGSYTSARSTPTVDGDFIYIMSGQGRITCHRKQDGKQVWYRDTLDAFKGENIRWGIAESVLIDGDTLICTPGGKDATVVALKKQTGDTIWTSKGLSEKSAYCSPCVIERGANRILLTMVEKSIVGIDIRTGKVLWQEPHKVSYDINAGTPGYRDGRMFVSNGYKHGTRMFTLSADGTSIRKGWHQKSLDIHHGGMVLVGDNLHGASGSQWQCLDQQTGDVKYSDKLVGKGSVVYADGLLYCYGEKGTLGLVRMDAAGYDMVSSVKITKGEKEHWAHPAISEGRLYIRHGAVLMCFDIKG
jgi:outer membrane protein assembly factor BamB